VFVVDVPIPCVPQYGSKNGVGTVADGLRFQRSPTRLTRSAVGDRDWVCSPAAPLRKRRTAYLFLIGPPIVTAKPTGVNTADLIIKRCVAFP